MNLRPATRPPLVTDEQITRLISEHSPASLIGRRARNERDLRILEALDWRVCQDADPCANRAHWRADATCPHCGNGLLHTCGNGLLHTGTTIYLCDTHYAINRICLEWARGKGRRYHHNTAEQVIAAITWTAL